jgi:hypothetical protein
VSVRARARAHWWSAISLWITGRSLVIVTNRGGGEVGEEHVEEGVVALSASACACAPHISCPFHDQFTQ